MAFLSQTENLWEEVAPPYRLGDVLVSSSDATGPHLSVVTDPAKGKCITTTAEYGCLVMRFRLYRSIVKALRWKGTA